MYDRPRLEAALSRWENEGGATAQREPGWVTDREHGRQFKAVFVKMAPPNTLSGIERYLGTGMVKGIGPVYASRLAIAFGTGVFDVIEQTTERLREIDGIGEKRARKITSGWADQKVIRKIMVFLHAHGVSTSRAVRIFKTYGHEVIAVARENPYQLADGIRGIGFLSADKIAPAPTARDGCQGQARRTPVVEAEGEAVAFRCAVRRLALGNAIDP